MQLNGMHCSVAKQCSAIKYRVIQGSFHHCYTHHSTHLSPVAHAEQMHYPCYQCVKHVSRVLQHTFSMCNICNAHHSTHLSPVAHAEQMHYPCYQCVKHVSRVLQHRFSMCNIWNRLVTRMVHANYHNAHHSTHLSPVAHAEQMHYPCYQCVKHVSRVLQHTFSMCNIWNRRVTCMLHANYHNAHHSTHLSPVTHAEQMHYPSYQCVKHVPRVLQHTFSMCNIWNTLVIRMLHVNYHNAHHSTHLLPVTHAEQMPYPCCQCVENVPRVLQHTFS